MNGKDRMERLVEGVQTEAKYDWGVDDREAKRLEGEYAKFVKLRKSYKKRVADIQKAAGEAEIMLKDAMMIGDRGKDWQAIDKRWGADNGESYGMSQHMRHEYEDLKNLETTAKSLSSKAAEDKVA